jgi:peptidoglycan hydrolase CwlO-like protein
MQRRRVESVMDALKKHWEILLVAAGCLIAWGSTAERVKTVREDLDEVQSVGRKDHDTIVEIRTEQRNMQKQVDKMDEKLDSILQKVKD